MWAFMKFKPTGLISREFRRTLKTVKSSFKKVLVLNKRTRYEIEKVLRPDATDSQLEHVMRSRGSDFDTILRHHNIHSQFYESLLQIISQYDVELRTVSRNDLNQDAVDWADLVVVAGGDGTFLLGASHIKNNKKPIVGFNSDPSRSEGHLCLPKDNSKNVAVAVKRIMKNDFKWFLRNRIEVTLTGAKANEAPIHMDDCTAPKLQQLAEQRGDNVGCLDLPEASTRVLPYLALNEVFLGEVLSSQVSYFAVTKDKDDTWVKVKCSGLCVCTGTGSTSWHLSINRMTDAKVEKLMEFAGVSLSQTELAKLSSCYNDSLVFDAGNPLLYYSFRDLIVAQVLPDPNGIMKGGFVDQLKVRSKCFNACLVIDGGCAYSFNDGTTALLTTNPDKALRTIIFC